MFIHVHRHDSTGLHGGSKRVALYEPTTLAIEKLVHVPLNGPVIFAHDPFLHTRNGAGGFEALVAPGDTIYMPGHLLHKVVNVGGFASAAVATRPWRASLWRDIAARSREIIRMSGGVWPPFGRLPHGIWAETVRGQSAHQCENNEWLTLPARDQGSQKSKRQ